MVEHLGKVSNAPVEHLDVVATPNLNLERVRLTANEFASRCPVTGQPDNARLLVEYTPSGSLVETKSFKLWLQRWRDVGQFNESIVSQIADEFYQQVAPTRLRVVGWFNARGGITVTAASVRGAEFSDPLPSPPELGGWVR